MKQVLLDMPMQHPAYAGHFPGNPVLPAACLLDAVLHTMQEAADTARTWQVANAKFPSAARPGDALLLERESLPNGTVRFAIRCDGRVVANGVLTPACDEFPDGEQA